MQRTAAQWALLCLLFLGVVGMHHVNVDAEMPAGHAVMPATADPHSDHAPDEPGPAPTHDMLHLCMAILCTVVPLLLLASLPRSVMRADENGAAAAPAWPRAPARPPPLGGRGLLSSLCVLRL